MTDGPCVTLDVPPSFTEAVARFAAALVLAQLEENAPAQTEGWLTPTGAAEYLGLSRKRIHDLTSMGALEPDGRDGRTPLYLRQTLDSYVRSQV